MSTPDADSVSCPNCKQPMQGEAFERHDHGTVRVDLCFDCGAIWFDAYESVQLAPSAVIGLFKEIAARRGGVRQSLTQQMACPRCREPLALRYDLCKTGRFSYFACPRGDGRFTPFFQFLWEKQFVRTLTGADLQRVRAQVRQIACSECGAPIDLERDSACAYCHAPVSYLDPDAVEKAVRLWSGAEARQRGKPSPEALADALLKSQLHRTPATGANRAWPDVTAGVDLVALGINLVGSLFQRHD